MAQTTIGVKLVYGDATVAGGVITPPTDWTQIAGLTGFPTFSVAPEPIDVSTTDEEKYKVYISGLMDLGGGLEFTAMYTPELRDAVEDAIIPPTGTNVRVFAVEIPAPLSERFWWVGQIYPVYPGEMEVNAAIPTTLTISQESEPTRQAITA